MNGSLVRFLSMAGAVALTSLAAGAQQRDTGAVIGVHSATRPASPSTVLALHRVPASITAIQSGPRRPHNPRKLYPAIGGLLGLAVGIGYTMQNAMGSPPPKDAGRVTLTAIGAGAAIGWIVGDMVARRRSDADPQ